MVAPKSLTPPISISTDAPFVTRNPRDAAAPLKPDANRKVTINSQAEFLKYSFPGSIFGTTKPIQTIYDADYQPLVFTIGTDDRLYMCASVNGAEHGIRSVDISPSSDLHVDVFSVFQAEKNVTIAVAGKKDKQTSTSVFLTRFDTPLLKAQSSSPNGLSGLEAIQWSAIETSTVSNLTFSALNCSLHRAQNDQLEVRVVGGVESTNRTEATFYTYSTAQPGSWREAPLPVSGHRIRLCNPVHLQRPLRDGYFYILKAEGDKDPESGTCYFQGHDVPKQLFFGKNKKPLSSSSIVHNNKYTDILLATTDGIAFFDGEDLNDEGPTDALGEGTRFNEVVGAQETDSNGTEHWSVFGLSSEHDVYFFEGKRVPSESEDSNKILWTKPLVPIRAGVRHLTCNFNARSGIHELVYVMHDSEEIRIVSRDPSNGLWNERTLISLDGKARTPKATEHFAFVVSLSFSDGKGQPVPSGYPIGLSSNSGTALINNKFFTLDKKPQTVVTNAAGKVVIALPTNGISVSSAIGVELTQSTPAAKKWYIHPAQRVSHIISSVKNGSDLSDAKTTDGKSVFNFKDNPSKEARQGDFDVAAGAIQKLAGALPTTNAGDEFDAPAKPLTAADIDVVWISSDDNSVKSQTGAAKTWIAEAEEKAGNFLGEVLEFLKTAVKKVVQVALKVIGPVLSFVIKIAGKIFKFVLDTVGKVLNCVLDVLQAVLPWDLSGIRDWLTFRYQKVEKTQKALHDLFEGGLTLTGRFLDANKRFLVSQLDHLEEQIEQSLPMAASGQPPSEQTHGSSILDNPVVGALMKFNPLGWIMEAVGEEFGEAIPTFVVTDDKTKLATLSSNDTLRNFLQSIQDSMLEAGSDPSSAGDLLIQTFRSVLKGIFSAVKTAISAMLDVMNGALSRITAFLNAEWKLGDLSELWETFTGCKLTLLNFLTYVLAQIIELFNFSGKAALEDIDISGTFASLSSKTMPTLATMFGVSDASDAIEPQEPPRSNISRRVAGHDASSAVQMGIIDSKPIQSSLDDTTEFTIIPNQHFSSRVASGSSSGKETAKKVIALARWIKSVCQCLSVAAEGVLESIEHARRGDASTPKGIMFGLNCLSFGVSALEFCLIDSWLSEKEQEEEGFKFLKFELVANMLRVFMSPAGGLFLTFGNFLVIGTAVVRASMITPKTGTEWAEIVGGAAGVIGTIGFAAGSQQLGWCCLAIDGVCAAVIFVTECGHLVH